MRTINYTKEERLAWSIKDAAKATSTSTSFIRKAIAGDVPKMPRLRTVRLGRRVLILDKDFREWMDGYQA